MSADMRADIRHESERFAERQAMLRKAIPTVTLQRARIYHPVVDTGACRLTPRVGVSRWNACLTKDRVYEMCGNACCLIYAYTPLHPARVITRGSRMKNVDPPLPPLPMNISDTRGLSRVKQANSLLRGKSIVFLG